MHNNFSCRLQSQTSKSAATICSSSTPLCTLHHVATSITCTPFWQASTLNFSNADAAAPPLGLRYHVQHQTFRAAAHNLGYFAATSNTHFKTQQYTIIHSKDQQYTTIPALNQRIRNTQNTGNIKFWRQTKASYSICSKLYHDAATRPLHNELTNLNFKKQSRLLPTISSYIWNFN